ncbi:hypothetical protein [Cupriavidus sp. AU9028]|nr:hypothetical protein [Cupriavidus sp. AU9028]
MRMVLRLTVAVALVVAGSAAYAYPDPALTEIFHCDPYMCW